MKRGLLKNIGKNIRKNSTRRLALLMASVMLITCAWTPAYADILDAENTSPEAPIVEDVEESAAEASGSEEQAGETFLSDDGVTSVKAVTNEQGETELSVETGEELIYDESKENGLEGFEYVGTGSSSGISVYKQTLTGEELEVAAAAAAAEEEELSAEVAQLLEEFNKEPLTEEELEQIIAEADEYSQWVKDTYFRKKSVATSSDALKRQGENRQDEAPLEEAEEKPEETEEGSEEESAEEEPVEGEVPVATPSEAVRPETLEAPAEESQEHSEEERAEEIPEEEESYPNNMEDSEYELICEPEKIDEEEGGYFESAAMLEYSEEAESLAPGEDLSLSTAGGSHTELSAEVLIVRKDYVYFQINTLDNDGNLVGGVNGAAVYLNKQDFKTPGRTGMTYCMSEHDGYLGFDDMKGVHYCFLNIALPGYITQTYDNLELEGGKLYTFNLSPVKDGELYLRSASLDGVDILHNSYELSIGEGAQCTYAFKYRVSVAGSTDASRIPDMVTVRTVPNRTEELLKKSPKKYRDKVFLPEKTSIFNFDSKNPDTVNTTKQFTIFSKWSKAPDFDGCSDTLDMSKGDNDTKVRFTPGNKVYIDLPEGYQWAQSGTRSIQLKLSVKQAVVESNFADNFTFNLLGSTGGSMEFNTDIIGLKNAKLESGLLKSRLTLAISPRGYGVVGYNAITPFQPIIDTLTKGEEHAFEPSWDYEAIGLRDRFQKNLDYIRNRAEKTIKYTKNGTGKYKRSLLKNFSITVTPSFMGVFNYNELDGDYSLDVVASVTITGAGSVTGYAFIGPVPFYGGAEGSVSGTLSGDVGCTFEKGLTNQRWSDLTGVSFTLALSIAAYVGCGWHGVVGAEVTGGGVISLKVGASKGSDDHLIITGGWNVGYRVYLLFASFKADFISDTDQLYPKKEKTDNDLEMLASPEISTAGKEEPMYVDALIEEGTSPGDQASGVMSPFVSNAIIQFSKAEAVSDEMSLSETKQVGGGITTSTNLQYVGDNGNSQALFRIANVKTDRGGVSTVTPRLVTQITRKNEDGSETSEYFTVSSTQTSEDDGSLLECERGVTYDYDYSFSVSKVGEGTGMYCAVIVSGPENQTELDRAAVQAAADRKQNQQKALLECRAENQRLRIVCFDQYGKVYSNRLISKDNIHVYMRDLNQKYAYLGTPAVYCPDSDPNHWWAVCALGFDLYETGGVSVGYTIANCRGGGETYIDRKNVIDGKVRSSINLMPRGDEGDFEHIWVASVVAEDDTQENSRYYVKFDGSWNYSALDPEKLYSSMNSISLDGWFTRKDRQWLNTSCIALGLSYRNRKFSKPVVNLAHANQDTAGELYFTSGQEIYRISSGYIYKLNLNIGEEEINIPEVDNTVNYFEHTFANGDKMLSLLSMYNVLTEKKDDGDSGTEGTFEADSDMMIRMIDFTESKTDRTEYTLSGQRENKIPDRYGNVMTGSYCRENAADTEPGIKIYYLADAKKEEVTAQDSEISDRFPSLKRVCDMYVFYWKADYGAKITALSAPAEPVEYESGKFTMNMTYRNVGPKTITDAVMVEWYAVNNGVEGEHHESVIPGTSVPGQTVSGSFEVPIDKSWNGWLRINASVTKVKVNGKWLDSNEAGYIPYWVTTEDLAGRMYIYPELDTNDDVRIRVEIKDGISKIENTRIKVYRQRVSVGENGKLEFIWDNDPYMLIVPNKAGTADLDGGYQSDYVWNIPFKTTGKPGGQTVDEDIWFKGFYKNGNQATDMYDVITDVNYSEMTAGLRFELCGWGDDAWNVAYDTKEVKNPLLDKLTHVTVKIKNPNYGYVTGTGYYRADGTVPVTAVMNTGYEIDYWEIYDGTSGTSVKAGRYENNFAFNPEAYTYSNEITVIGWSRPVTETYFVLELYRDYDEETGEKMGEVFVNLIAPGTERDMDTLSPTTETDTMDQYTVLAENSTALVLSTGYDTVDYKFVGWYRSNRNENGTVWEGDTLLSKERELTLSYSIYVGYYVRIHPVFVKQDNPIVTFDPGDGTLIGDPCVPTKDNKCIQWEILSGTFAEKPGYQFVKWIKPNGETVTRTTGFTEDTTVRAVYKALPEHSLKVMSDYPERGSIEVQGMITDYADLTVWKGNRISMTAVPNSYPDGYGTNGFNEDKEYKLTGWTVYEVVNKDTWAESDYQPEKYELTEEEIYIFDVQDKDWVAIAHFEREDEETTKYDLINVKTDMGADGLQMAELKVDVSPATNAATARKVNDELWEIQYDKIKGDDIVLLQATLKDEYKADYTFDGWYTYSYCTDGELLLENKLSDNSFIFHRNGDVFCYAKWNKKTEQNIYFSQETVTVNTEASGKVNTLHYERGEAVYSCDDPTVVEVNSTTGEIGIPKKAGTVHISAVIPGDEEYLESEASYELVIEKTDQHPAFTQTSKTVSIDGNSFRNELKDARSAVEYSTEDPQLALVDSNGWVTPGSKRGTVRIKATAVEDDRYNAATAEFTVTITGLTQTPEFAQNSVSKVCFEDDFINELTGAEGTLRFESSNTEVAQIVDQKTGKVRIGDPGMAEITVYAEGNDYYEPAEKTYTLTVAAAPQGLEFDEASVEKKYGDEPFINTLSGAKGTVKYTSSDPKIASVDKTTGKVTVKEVGEVVITVSVTATGRYAADSLSYTLSIGKADQTPAFEKAEDTVSYGEAWYVNPVLNSVGDLSYTMVSEMTVQGIGDEEHVAVVDASTGKLEIKNAGTITVRVDAAGDKHHNPASAQYVLTVEPKSMRALSIGFVARTDELRVFDGSVPLVEGKDYTASSVESGQDIVYTVTGKGNYKDSWEVTADDSGIRFVQESFQTWISEDIAEEDFDKARELLGKVSVSGFDKDKVPTEEILQSLIGDGRITQTELDDAVFVGFVVNVDVELKSMNDATGKYVYELSPQAVVIITDIELHSKVVVVELDPDWFSSERDIIVVLGVGEAAKKPNRIIHTGENKKVIGRYTAGTEASGSHFVYDDAAKTVTLAIEHCSTLTVCYEKPSGGGSGGSGGSGGGGGGVSSGFGASKLPTYSNFWIQNPSGEWQVWYKGQMIRSVWFCDDAVSSNGKNVWYLLNADGNMISAGLVQDQTGNFYSIETEHNGYYGMLRYRNGTYNCGGQQIYLEFEQDHNGAFGAVKNADGLAKLKAIYGVTQIGISNANIVYSSSFN